MANIRNLKKDINYVLSDIIEAVYFWEITNNKHNTKESAAIIDNAITIFDDLIVQVNTKGVANKKAHFTKIRVELEEKNNGLMEKLNKLS